MLAEKLNSSDADERNATQRCLLGAKMQVSKKLIPSQT
jgi:hypothetical protein